MNPIDEQLFMGILARVEALEIKVSRISIPDKKGYHPTKNNSNPGTATPGQINYVKMLGGQTWEGMTKQEAGEQIDRLKKTKELIKKEGEMAQEMTDKSEEQITMEAEEKQEEGTGEFPDY